jgi:tetratricopeptide (TPR) repeat protein
MDHFFGFPSFRACVRVGILSGQLALVAALASCTTKTATPDNSVGATPIPAATAKIPPYGEDLRVSHEGLNSDTLYTLLVAELAGQRGDIDLALSNYVKLMRAIPNVDIAERTAKVAAYAQKDDIATEAAQRWVDLAPKSLDARQTLAGEFLRTGKRDEAVAQLNYILQSAEAEPAQRMWAVANLLSREQDRKAALGIMDQLIAQHGKTPEALLADAMLAIRAEQPDKARAAMDEAMEIAPGNEGVALAYVGVLQKQGNTDTALKWLGSVLKKHPNEQGIRLIYARLFADNKQYDEAYREFKTVEKAQPDNADVRYALGLLELQRQNSAKAKPYFKALASNGEHADEARFYLGQIAESEKNDAEARKWFEQVQDGDLRVEAKLRVAAMLAHQGKIQDAQKYLQGVEPQSAAEHARLVRAQGEILIDAGQLRAAMDVYDKALQDNYDSELLYSRAMLAEKMNRLDVLERDLRRILENEPDNSQALNALGYTLADRTTRYEEAHALIKRALELSPNDFYILDSMGWVLYKLGKNDEAIVNLKKARELRDDPEVVAHLIEVLVAKGDKQQARDIFHSSIKANPDDEHLKKTKQKFGL